MNEIDAETVALFRAHMDLCMKAVVAPMRRPDIKVTIIVRAPEALPAEAMISTNDDLAVVRDAVTHFAGKQSTDRPDVTRNALDLLRSLCAALGTFHCGTYDPHNAQVILNFNTNEEAAAAWQAARTMWEIAT